LLVIGVTLDLNPAWSGGTVCPQNFFTAATEKLKLQP
jgi:hypothetical protein